MASSRPLASIRLNPPRGSAVSAKGPVVAWLLTPDSRSGQSEIDNEPAVCENPQDRGRRRPSAGFRSADITPHQHRGRRGHVGSAYDETDRGDGQSIGLAAATQARDGCAATARDHAHRTARRRTRHVNSAGWSTSAICHRHSRRIAGAHPGPDAPGRRHHQLATPNINRGATLPLRRIDYPSWVNAHPLVAFKTGQGALRVGRGDPSGYAIEHGLTDAHRQIRWLAVPYSQR
jgi:hypothetical protein